MVVEKLNMIKRHTKPRPAPRSSGIQQVIPGGVIEREAPLHISNVQLICPGCGKPSRVGYRINADGNKVRVCRACGKDVDRMSTMEIPTPRLQGALRRRDPAGAARSASSCRR